jgi:AraC-like DNA-binding protein
MRLNGITQLCKYELDCIDQAIAYIQKYYRNAISAESLSVEAGMSIRKLRAGLKKKTGLSLHEFHFKVRVEQAKPMLLNTAYPLKAIANSVGFKTESHFCKRFKEITALTPIEYRLKNAE